jgi:hypothetical protein
MRSLVGALCALSLAAALAFVFSGQSVSAWEAPCDFLTGGGYIITTASGTHDPAKANFGVGGGCKHGSPTWGHLNYIDHGTGLHVHWTAITAYLAEGDGAGDTILDPQTHQPLGTRLICGTAWTNQLGDVDFMVRAKDAGEPGVNDEFDIRLSQAGLIVYTTENEPTAPHKLNDGQGGGGNIQLHKPNPSTTGSLGGDCPARDAIGVI